MNRRTDFNPCIAGYIRRKVTERLLEYIKRSCKVDRGTYGSPRITTDIQERGHVCGKNRIARLMRLHGIAAKTKRKFKATTNSKHNLPVAPNLLKQQFAASEPDKGMCIGYNVRLD